MQSNGHGSTLIYALLHLAGYEAFPIEQVRAFRELGSHTPGHPEYEPAHGVEVTTGPLGQGIANAAGMAVAEAMLNAEFGDAIVDHYTYALVGDGCLMEGIGHEIVSLAGHLRLGKLIFLYDSNRMTDDGATSQAISEDYLARFACAGWQVQECDGHDQEALAAAILLAKKDPRPSMIKCNTTIGFGVPRIQNQRVAHGGKLFEDDCRAAREHLGWPHAPFVVPQPIVEEWRKAGSRGAAERRAWEDRFARLDSEQRAKFERLMRGELPTDWDRTLRDYKREAAANAPSQPTVRSSGEITRVLSHAIPELVGGAPDLEAATQHKRDMLPFSAEHRAGRYLHYGVREHAMGAMMNGMVAHRGVVPYGATFLVFSDYMRHSIRLSAMMSLPVIWVFSHDSIGIGKNGPTHQPVEYLASLRAMPNLDVMRPCRRRRGGGVLAARGRQPALADRDRQLAPGAAGDPHEAHRRESLCARRLRAGRPRGWWAPRDDLRQRLGSRDRARRPHRAAGAGSADGGDLRAVLGALRAAGRHLPRDDRRTRHRPGRRRGRREAGLGAFHRRGRLLHRHEHVRRLRAGSRTLPPLRHHAGSGGRRGVAATHGSRAEARVDPT